MKLTKQHLKTLIKEELDKMKSNKVPTMKTDADGTKRWLLNGKLHRENGPAIESANGDKRWYLNGQLHREDGPAAELASGTKHWYRNGQPDREDGPAIEFANGDQRWYLNGKQLSQSKFNQAIKTKNAPYNDKTVVLDGITYKLTAL